MISVPQLFCDFLQGSKQAKVASCCEGQLEKTGYSMKDLIYLRI